MPQATPLNELIVNINSRVQGQYQALCPAHDDNNPSLSVKVDGDNVLWNCLAECGQEQVQAALIDAGMQWGKPKETAQQPPKPPANAKKSKDSVKPRPLPKGGNLYRYNAKDGSEVLVVHRSPAKQFSQWTPAGNGLYIAKAPDTQRPLYRLNGLTAGPVTIFEGEKCVHAALEQWPNGTFTTFAGGCQAWQKTDYSPLTGHKVTLVSDGGEAGRRGMNKLAAHLHKTGADVYVYYAPGSGKDDIVDWMASEGAESALKRLRSAIPYIVPEKTDELNLAAFNAEIDVLLEQAGGDAEAFVKEHGLKLLARAKAFDVLLRKKQVVNLWIVGRLLLLHREFSEFENGQWTEFIKKAGWDERRARMAIQIYRRNDWDNIAKVKTQNQA